MSDFDITTVRKLTALRNRMAEGDPLRERLTLILNTAEEINKETTDQKRREALIGAFRKYWAEYVAAGGTAA